MYKIKNKTFQPVVVNLPGEDGKTRALYLPPRGEAVISEEEYNGSPDVKAKVRLGVLRKSYV